jgi:hypothetical protein
MNVLDILNRMNFPSRAERGRDSRRALHGPIQAFREIPTEFRPKVGGVCVRAIARDRRHVKP